MEEHEPINELCVVAVMFHPVHGLLLSYTKNGACKLTEVCDVEPGDAWPETLQRHLQARYGSFSYEILSLAKMETFTAQELFEAPRFGLFVICQTEDNVDIDALEGEYRWCHRDEEINRDTYCHQLFKKIAQEVLQKHYPTQLQFSL